MHQFLLPANRNAIPDGTVPDWLVRIRDRFVFDTTPGASNVDSVVDFSAAQAGMGAASFEVA